MVVRNETSNLPLAEGDVVERQGVEIGKDVETQGLADTVRGGIEDVYKTPEPPDVIYTKLTPEQAEYVCEAIDTGYERYKVVNRPLIGKEGVPGFPSKDVVLRSALAQLTSVEVDYMMEEGRVPFGFRLKLVCPNNRVDLTRTLINGQPKKMSTSSVRQKDLEIWDRVARHLIFRNNGNSNIEWKWSFYQGPQVIDTVEAWDDHSKPVQARLVAFKNQLPEGMKGTDRFDLATSMADGLEAGKPMDIRFEADATNLKSYEQWDFTLADEEGQFKEGSVSYIVGGSFCPDYRRAYLGDRRTDFRADFVRFRASVDGSIQS